MPFQTRFNNFIHQLDILDGLILPLLHNSVYQAILEVIPLRKTGSIFVVNKYEDFSKFIINSTFVLGYSYFEAYLTDIARECLRLNPALITKEDKNKEDKEIAISEVLRNDFFLFKDKIKFYNNILRIRFEDDNKEIEAAHLIRNCIMHNAGIIDKRLAKLDSRYIKGNEINISLNELDAFGIIGRTKAKIICENAIKEYDFSYSK